MGRPVANKLELPDKLHGNHLTFLSLKLKRCFVNEDLVIRWKKFSSTAKFAFYQEPRRLWIERTSSVDVAFPKGGKTIIMANVPPNDPNIDTSAIVPAPANPKHAPAQPVGLGNGFAPHWIGSNIHNNQNGWIEEDPEEDPEEEPEEGDDEEEEMEVDDEENNSKDDDDKAAAAEDPQPSESRGSPHDSH
ncbi:hypothetical protein Tco_0330877 [Tanacetum coccineum]